VSVLRTLVGITMLVPVCVAAPAVVATITQRVHPVLIRNDHNELLELNVTVKGPGAASLQGVTCTLDSGGVQNVELLQLLSTGEKRVFAPGAEFGAAVSAAAKFTFLGNQPLREGSNLFWLSARLKADASLSGRVRATCSLVKTSAGNLTPEGSGTALSRRIGVALRKHGDDGVHTYRIPSLTKSANGTLLSVYDMRRRMSRDLQEDIDIGLSRSTDGGKTWQSPRVIMDMGEYGGLPQEQNGCSDPGIIVDPKTGEIFVFAVWMNGKPGKHQWRDDGSEPGFEIGKSAQIMMVRSSDDGLTWTKPENLTRTLKKPEWWLIAPAPQAGVALPDGTLVMPMEGRDEKGVGFATIMSSKDHGKSWTVGAPAFFGGNECQAARLSDGSIMLNIRNRKGFRAVFVTKDLGRTWRPHETNNNTLLDPGCNGSLYRVEGRPLLLFANPHNETVRSHHTIQVSHDDGRTWPERLRLLLDEGKGRGYPSMVQVDAEHLGIVYEGSRADLTFEKISLSELLER